MRKGMNRFIYREINELMKMGLNITLFPTKYAKGPYMSENTWGIHIYNPFTVILHQLLFFIENPIKYVQLLSETVRNRSLIDLLIAIDFSYYMKKEGINRIHCHFADHKLFIGYYCKRILKIPLSVTIHAYELYNNPNWVMFYKSLKNCDNIITISEYNKHILTSKFGLDEDVISVIRLFADDKKRENKLVHILIVGRYVEKKGHKILFKAIKLLGRDDVYVWVAGIGDDSGLKEMARVLGIEDKITFFGTVSDEMLDLLYTYCDIFCLPSRKDDQGDQEGIPVALMEAMFYGKPVISTKHAGIPELVRDILIEENNVEALTEAITELVNNTELREHQGKKNREIIESKYSKRNLMKLKYILCGDDSELLEKK